MVADLPESVAPQLAIELVVRELARLHPWFLRLIMEDPNVRETYQAAIDLIAEADIEMPKRFSVIQGGKTDRRHAANPTRAIFLPKTASPDRQCMARSVTCNILC